MNRSVITASFPAMTEEDYQAKVDHWLALKDVDEAKEYYEREVLPRSAYRVRDNVAGEPCDLLFIPVGTQAYAPLMCALGNPAKRSVLLMTKESRQHALELEEVFEGKRDFEKTLIDETDPADITRKVMATYTTLGQPLHVVCDVTGGTKIMTSTLAGIAAVNGWRQTYVKSLFVFKKGSHHEEIISVSSAFEHLGGWHITQANTLASAGQFGAAAKALIRAAEQSVASAEIRRRAKLYRLAQLYREADLDGLRKSLSGVLKATSSELPSRCVQAIDSGDNRGFLYWVGSTLAAEGQDLAALSCFTRLGTLVEPKTLKVSIKEYKERFTDEWKLKDWKPLNDLLGSRLSREAKALG